MKLLAQILTRAVTLPPLPPPPLHYPLPPSTPPPSHPLVCEWLAQHVVLRMRRKLRSPMCLRLEKSIAEAGFYKKLHQNYNLKRNEAQSACAESTNKGVNYRLRMSIWWICTALYLLEYQVRVKATQVLVVAQINSLVC